MKLLVCFDGGVETWGSITTTWEPVMFLSGGVES